MSNAPDLQSMFLAAKAAYQSSRFNDAEAICAQILNVAPSDLGARSLLGLVAGQTGRPELAIELLSGVAEVDPNSWGVLNALSTVLRQENRLNEAMAVRQRALGLRPNDANGHNELGLCLLARNEFRDAGECFLKAIQLDPTAAVHFYNLGTAFNGARMFQQAEKAFRQAVALAPQEAKYLEMLGDVWLFLGKRAEAIDSFRQAHALQGDPVRANIDLVKALAEEGDLKAAEETLGKVVEADPGTYEVCLFAGASLSRWGKFEEARPFLERAMSARPSAVEPYPLLVDSHKMLDTDRPLIASMERLLGSGETSDDEQANIHLSLGKSYGDLREFETSMRHYDSANAIGERLLRISRGPFERERYETGVDFMIATYNEEFFASGRMKGSDSETPVFIAGMMRSGTTLVEQILSSHSAVTAGGELLYWIERGRELYASKQSAADLPDPSRWANEYLEILRRLGPDSLRVTAKNPQDFTALGMIHAFFPKAKIVHCRRSPIDVCLSVYVTRNGNRPEFSCNKKNIMFMYDQYARLAVHWRKVLPADRYLEVTYESFVADREGQTRRLIDFLGLPWEEGCLHHDRNTRTVATPSLWQVRQPIYKTSVERWRNYEPWLGEFRELIGREPA